MKNHVVAGDSPAAFEFDLVCFYSCQRPMPPALPWHLPSRAGRPRPHNPYPPHTPTTHFANTMVCGARFVVAVIVLLGSPPVSWLITNLVMFFED